MPKRQKKEHSTSRVSTSMSISPEEPAASMPEMGGEYVPTYEEIQQRAYHIHEEKGGSDLENWLEAERILKEEHQMRQ